MITYQILETGKVAQCNPLLYVLHCTPGMTSLIELSRTEEQKKIAQSLAEIGVLVESDLLLADERTSKRCHISKHVRALSSIANIRLSSNSVQRSSTPVYTRHEEINSLLRQLNLIDCPLASSNWMKFLQEVCYGDRLLNLLDHRVLAKQSCYQTKFELT
jgi:hypothetical protein